MHCGEGGKKPTRRTAGARNGEREREREREREKKTDKEKGRALCVRAYSLDEVTKGYSKLSCTV